MPVDDVEPQQAWLTAVGLHRWRDHPGRTVDPPGTGSRPQGSYDEGVVLSGPCQLLFKGGERLQGVVMCRGHHSGTDLDRVDSQVSDEDRFIPILSTQCPGEWPPVCSIVT